MRGRRKFELTPRYLLVIFTAICALLLACSAFFGTQSNPLSNVTSAVIIPMQKGINSIGNWFMEKSRAFENIKIYRRRMKNLKIK